MGGDLTKPQTLAATLHGVSAGHLLGAIGHDHASLRTGPQIMAVAAEAGGFVREKAFWHGFCEPAPPVHAYLGWSR
ncbi:hypothetical protein ACH4ZU_08140 [Streptomyces sp. NPDC020472]|uniref:hypothetical protein n=1 Tax=Streptomyces sp. NPDC020472 TaxID=3365075 RepID=UPI00379C50F6